MLHHREPAVAKLLNSTYTLKKNNIPERAGDKRTGEENKHEEEKINGRTNKL